MDAGAFSVVLEPHTGLKDTPTGKVEVNHNQYRVFVESEDIKFCNHHLRNPSGRIHVGYIGKQRGANFMPTNEFNEFAQSQRDTIVSEVKKQHGSASDRPHQDLADLPVGDDEDTDEQPEE